MSIPNETLQKLFREIQAQAIESQRQVALVNTQVTAKKRELRLRQLTSSEIDQLPAGTNVYEGVGKMFVATSAKAVDTQISKESETLQKEISNLEKKLHSLNMTVKNSQEHTQKILGAGVA